MQSDAIQLNGAAFAAQRDETVNLMTRYQRADAAAVTALVDLLSPQLFQFFAGQMGSRADAEDMLQELWLRIHRFRHTYRPGEPVYPWVYAIAHRVRVDSYRRRRRISSRQLGADVSPEVPAENDPKNAPPSFDDLAAALPESQREVLVMLKVNGLSIEEVARATGCTPGAAKQKAHRAYERLRSLLTRTQSKRTEPREVGTMTCKDVDGSNQVAARQSSAGPGAEQLPEC
jgi:RNA polymerase sigma-70 factor, ECF subfamily